MGKSKTIYSTKGIFTKLLEDTEKEHFLIPTYQRGYKWSSEEDDSQVKVLLNDLFSAYSNSSERYYLQFITLKDSKQAFEVIDGQQRLTTLTVLFGLFFAKLKGEDNFIANKLNYQIRKNFLEEFIYTNGGIQKITLFKTWEEFISENKEHNNQDVFYLFHATKTIDKFLSNIPNDELLKFFNYIANKVQIIVNVLDNEMNSEKIFINVNKGVKLKDEDLVKGLLITKIPLDNKDEKYRLTENEINEIRSLLGKQWDEISHWANRKDIVSFYKQKSDGGIGWIIKLAYPSINSIKSDIPIFTYLSEQYQKGEKATKIFERIYSIKLILDDWFNIPEIHNLLGFLLHSENNYTLSKIWNEVNGISTKKDIIKILKEMIIKEIPFDESIQSLKELNYNDNKSELFTVFLSLDIIKCLPINKEVIDFYNFKLINDENWSIEHIFPQNPEDLKNITDFSHKEIDILKELLPDKINEDEISVKDADEKDKIINLLSKIKNTTDKLCIADTEKSALVYLLSKNANDLHRIGNLALLELGINSSLSNNFFDKKRKKIASKVSLGRFVPFHTYDVFSKLIIKEKTNLHIWSRSDILEHEKYINERINELFIYLKQI
jgi:uncharacterized protein with ParB-like and HNH nuclease domain